MTPAPEVKLMRVKGTDEVIEVQRVNGKWVERAKIDAGTPIVDGRADISAKVNEGLEQPEPAAPKQAPEPAPSGGVMQTGKDFARGVGRGLTSEWGDEVSAWLASRGADKDRLRAKGRGLDAPAMTDEEASEARYTEMRDSERRDNAEAQARSPIATSLGRGTGMGMQAIALTGAAAPFRALDLTAGAANAARNANLAAGVLGAGALAGTGAAGETEKEGLEAAKEGADAAKTAMTVAGGIPAAASGVKEGVRGAKKAIAGSAKLKDLAEWLSNEGKSSRAAAAGFYGGEFKKVGRQRGKDIDVRIGDAIERSGADKRPAGSMLPRSVPQSAAVYDQTLPPAVQRAGQRMSDAVDVATEGGKAIESQALVAKLRDVQAKHLADNTPRGRALAGEIDKIIGDIKAEHVGRAGRAYSTRELFDKRLKWKPDANLKADINVMPEGDSARVQAYRDARNVLGDIVSEQAGPGYAGARDDYGLLKMAANAARDRTLQERGNQILSLPTAGYATAGSVLGSSGGAPGTILGGLGAVGASEALKRVGRDAVADVAGALSRPAVASAPVRAGVTEGIAPATAIAQADDARRDASRMQAPAASPEMDEDLMRAARILKIDPNNKNAKKALELLTGAR